MRLGIGIQGHAKLFQYAYKIPTIRFTPDYLGLQIVHIITILTCAPGVYFHCLIKNSGNGLADIRLTVTLPGSNDRRRKAKTGRLNLIFCQTIPQKAKWYGDLTFKKGRNARKSTLHKREGQGPRRQQISRKDALQAESWRGQDGISRRQRPVLSLIEPIFALGTNASPDPVSGDFGGGFWKHCH